MTGSAHWIPGGTPKSARFRCSACDAIVYYPQPGYRGQKLKQFREDHPEPYCPYPYCPYCKKRIDDGGNER